MIENRWESADYMMEVHGLTKESLHVFAWKDRRENGGYTRKDRKQVYYNAGKLERLRKQKENDWHKSHDLYYEVKEIFKINDSEIGRSLLAYGYGSSLDSWRYFLSQGMWMLRDLNTILATVNKRDLTKYFNEWATYILQGNEMEDFDTVEDYYSYFEAKKLKEELVA